MAGAQCRHYSSVVFVVVVLRIVRFLHNCSAFGGRLRVPVASSGAVKGSGDIAVVQEIYMQSLVFVVSFRR